MSTWVKVAEASEIPAGKSKCVSYGRYNLAVFNVNGEYFAIDDECPHAGASLSEGEVVDNTLTCPWHAADFDLRTGACLGGPSPSGVTAYKVQVEGNEVKVEFPS